MEAEERAIAMSAPHDVPIRSAAPQQSARAFDDIHQRSNATMAADEAQSRPSEVWAGAISRVQTQVSSNTGLLDAERHKVHHIERSIERIERNLNETMMTLQSLCDEVRSRSGYSTERHDPADLQAISEQVGILSTRVNEVDALRMKVTLLENRLKRQEGRGSPPTIDTRPTTAAAPPPLREGSISSQSIGAPPVSSLPPTHHALPPMRTSAHMSPADSRPMQHTTVGMRQQSAEPFGPMHAPAAGGFRLGEPLPPPSALAGWRTGGEPTSGASSLPPPQLPIGPARQHVLPSDGHNAGWAAVNAAPTTKRPYEEPRQSPYESSLPGSPKRPKLAPIMPRSNYSEDASFVPASVPQSGTESHRTHSRAPSDGSQSQSAPTPASANMPGRRFIISTQSADSQESWRPEHERTVHMGPHGHGHGHGPHGPGRRGGRGGRARGRGHGLRGGRGGVLLTEGFELGTPEWERADWTGSQVSNGFYHPLNHPPQSPEDSSRGGIVRRGGSSVGGPSEREVEFPATPLAVQGPYDPFTAGHPDSAAGHPTSGGKKSRTKPTRNSDGVLIRKDGRPDMRSVSSANNLRKVHAKKEAERAEIEGRTPTSARSLAPAGSMSDDDDDADSQSESPDAQMPGVDERSESNDTQERHRELMSRIFPSGAEEASRNVGERFFPSRDHQDASESSVKREVGSSEASRPGDTADHRLGQSSDVVMEESVGADTKDRKEGLSAQADTRMATVEEVNEEQEKAGEETV